MRETAITLLADSVEGATRALDEQNPKSIEETVSLEDKVRLAKQWVASFLKTKEKEIEDRKDKRTRIAGTQQSQMIDQRQNDLLPIDFEAQSGQQPTI
mgnify:CR=1 FL=1